MRPFDKRHGEMKMSISTILLIILVLLLIGALPTWPYSGGWGYYPSGGLGLVLIVLLVLMVSGRL
jgi:hypothetical protein